MKFYEVGGCVRDDLLGVKTKDIDFAVDMTEDFSRNLKVEDMFEVMRAQLDSQGFEEFVVTPEYFTTRCKVPVGHPLETRTRVADFVMCRSEGPYTDGRRPDWVQIGDIFDDLQRRDFTMNAIARTPDGILIDPHGGADDVAIKRIKFVGDPRQRIMEDGLRILRGLRFMVTKGFSLDTGARMWIETDFAAECLARPSIADERIKDELDKMFHADSLQSIKLMNEFPKIAEVCFAGQVRLAATMKK